MRVELLDQILLDVRHVDSARDETTTIRKKEDTGTFQSAAPEPKGKGAIKKQATKSSFNVVLVSIGRDPITNKSESIYMNAKRPIWVPLSLKCNRWIGRV